MKKCKKLYSWLKRNLGDLYYVLPYLEVLENKNKLIFDILCHKKQFELQLKCGVNVALRHDQFLDMINLLGAITYSTSCNKVTHNSIELCFDMKNKFIVDLNNLGHEDGKLLSLLFEGSRSGASFVTNSNESLGVEGKTLKISERAKKKIVETGNGLKFYLDSITPGIIVETYIRKMHVIEPSESFTNKIVVDVGGECGDTAIYYASRGATVYVFEPVKAHYEAMLRNISLNPDLAEKIIPTNSAIGKDGILKFYLSNRSEIAETASFVYNTHGSDAKVVEISGYSLESAYAKYNLQHIDLLKMDCKGCEFFLNSESLKNVDSVKIEYLAYDESHKLEDLLKILKENGFEFIIFRHEPFYYRSNLFCATIYGKKSNSKSY